MRYWVWFLADYEYYDSPRAFFRTGRGFRTRQAANKWAKKDGRKFMVLKGWW